MRLLQYSIVLGLASVTFSSPIRRSSNAITAEDILAVAPNTASCDGSRNTGECITAANAAPYIAISFLNFNLASFGEQAAVLALVLYESGDFAYNRNHFPAPGVPGQGTRNMQSPAYNLKYASWLSQECSNCGISPSALAAAQAQGPAAVLDLVNGDQWGFASAAWFLRWQCDSSVRSALAEGTLSGWEQYLACIGTSATAERTAVWQKVMALGQW